MKKSLLPVFCLFALLLINLTEAQRRNQHHRNNNDHNRNKQNENESNHQSNRPTENRQPGRESENRQPNRKIGHSLDEDMKNPLSKDDFDRAKSLNERYFAIDDKILYSGKLFEGDIADNLLDNSMPEKNAVRNPGSHWPNGRVPYVISRDFSGEERAVIARAIDEYHSKTCIRFEPYDGREPNYIHIKRGSGCSSRVGMAGGVQEVSLGQGCATVGIVEHELMHVLGFVHEQSRTDRDRYIRINYPNIRRGLEQNFRKYSVEEITSLNEPYDYGSVLHYGPTAFSNGNGLTIETLERGAEIGQRIGFSEIDLAKINKLYRCGGRPGSNSERPGSSDRHRPNRERPGISSRPDSGSLSKPEYGGGSGYRPGSRPSLIDSFFGGHRPSSGNRPGSNRPDTEGEYRPGHANRPGSENRPDHGHNNGNRPSGSGSHGFRPSTVDPEYESGGGGSVDRDRDRDRYSTHRPSSGFGGYSSTYRPYGSSRPEYGNNFGNHRPGYDRETSTFRPFGSNIGSIGNGISSIFGNRLPGSSIIDNFRPGGSNIGNIGGNRGSSLISSFFRPDRITSLIGLLGQDDPNNQPTTKSPSTRN